MHGKEVLTVFSFHCLFHQTKLIRNTVYKIMISTLQKIMSRVIM